MLAVARAQPGLAIFTLAYLGGFLAFGMVIGSELTVPYAILITILILVVTAVHRRVDLGRGVALGPLGVGPGPPGRRHDPLQR